MKRGVETELVYSILDYLGILGVAAFRRNVGAMEYLKSGGSRGVVRFGQSGQSDIWFVGPNACHGEIEAKSPGKEPTPEQAEWLNFMLRKGCIAFWCDSLDGCIEQLKAEYLKRNWIWRKEWEL